MSTKEITIAGVICTVGAPYAEGHTITGPEAAALNQTRAENLRNNLAAKVKKVLGEVEPKDATPDQMREIAQLVQEYDHAYIFTPASAGGGRRSMDPLEKMCHKIARDAIVAQLAKAGKKVKDVDKDALADLVARTAESPNVMKLAKKRLKEAEELAELTAGVEVADAAEEVAEEQAA